MELCEDDGGYICNTGEMNPRDVSEPNKCAYVRAAKELAKY
jgi:hypothetical protein